jgi:dTDP-4-dehydrorhamnose reductase
MHTILVTGSNGQLGQELRKRSESLPYLFYFTDSKELDITNRQQVEELFGLLRIEACINCAAYTAVDRAENDHELAHRINVEGAGNLATACQIHGTLLFHISTDFVFDGAQGQAYVENDPTSPINVYGDTKRQGELRVLETCSSAMIVRTSWLYSQFGNNFVKTMIRLASERPELRIVADQIGSPTYAGDLADTLLYMANKLIELPRQELHEQFAGIYHYSNEGVASWYDFASAILELWGSTVPVLPIAAAQYPTPAKRPPFSVMSKQKIKKAFGLEIPHWRKSLQSCVNQLRS